MSDYGHLYDCAMAEANSLRTQLASADADNARLREALRPFVEFRRVQMEMGGTTPKSGPIYSVSSRAGTAEITVEDLEAAREALSSPAPSPSAELAALKKVEEAARDYFRNHLKMWDVKACGKCTACRMNAALSELDRVRGL